jgi:myosin heavy subunit
MAGAGETHGSAEKEIQYWKQQALASKQSADEAREELEEFRISSRELELELETQLEQAERKYSELIANNERLQRELDSVKEHLQIQQGSSQQQITKLQDELAQVTAHRDELEKYIRELEQMNDDLERAKRQTVVSLEDFERRLNEAIERNAFLESELEEKDTLAITVQRLKDETRDLCQELAVQKQKGDLVAPRFSDSSALKAKLEPADVKVDMPSLPAEVLTVKDNTSTPASNANHLPFTPAARINALNIVGDLLHKVGALESKLASCRNYVSLPQQQVPNANAVGSNVSRGPPRVLQPSLPVAIATSPATII